MNMTKSRLLTVCVGLSLLFRAVIASADEPHFQRWAVLPAPEVADTGLSDLLIAELSQRQFDLVEREQLAAIVKEIELSKLLSPEGSSQRLKVGQLAKADALVLLSLIENDKKKFVKLVISDCRYGSRLRLEHFPFAADRADKLAGEIAQAAVETRTKFARGVERIVAVSPFLSKNLTHEFDHLQFGFAALLGQGLSERPGVAVLEIEEARAIGEELTRSTTELERRSAPLFVEGEFEVLTPAIETGKDTLSRTVRFSFRVFDGRKEREAIPHSAQSLAAATSWITETFPGRVLRHSESDTETPSLTRGQQREHLLRRADSFSSLANFAPATALQEAALLLDQDDWQQRLQLIGDYCRWQQQRESEITDPAFNKVRQDPKIRANWQKELWSRAAMISRHIEDVLSRGVCNPVEAWTILSTALRSWESVVNYPCVVDAARGEYRDFFWRNLRSVSKSDSRIRGGGTHPVIVRAFGLSNDREARTVSEQDNEWSLGALSAILQRLPKHFDGSPPRFDDKLTIVGLDQLFSEILPEGRLIPGLLPALMGRGQAHLPHLVASRRVPERELLGVWDRLQTHGKPLLEFYARFGRLGLKATGVSSASTTADDLAETKRLEEFLQAWQKAHPGEQLEVLGANRAVALLRSELQQAISSGGRKKGHTSTDNPIHGTDPFPKLAFEPLPNVTANWTSLTKCRDDLDVMWSADSVAVMRRPGEAKVICRSDLSDTSPFNHHRDAIYSVACDGEFVWVASAGSGLRIVTMDGEQVGQLRGRSESDPDPSDGRLLPPFEQVGIVLRGLSALTARMPMQLHSLGPGRCFVTGRFGKDKRRWFGIVSRDADPDGKAGNKSSSWRFTLWHQATKQPPSETSGTDDDTQLSFDPVFILDHVSPDDVRQRCLLLGRRTMPNQTSRPLAFDLATGQVSIFPQAVCRTSESGNVQRVGDDLVGMVSNEIFRAPLKSQSEARFETVYKLMPVIRPPAPTLYGMRGQLLRTEHWLYNPGKLWHRVDTRNWQVERLTTEPVSRRFDFESYGVSAHYGLVAWNYGDTLHRVHVGEAETPKRDLSWIYPFIPESDRDRHAHAVEAIRRLGGSVDSVRSTVAGNVLLHHKDWRTVVYLSESWKGGDEGLQLLADLHNLRELYLIRAAITNDGLKHVGQFGDLEILHLEETRATDAGLIELKPLSKLQRLRLEGQSGGTEFGDDGLSAFKGHLALQSLTVSGQRFTNGCVPRILDLPKLREIRFLDTSVTADGIADAKKKRVGLLVLSEHRS